MSSPVTPPRRPAIVFDMDGVLADTERLKFRAHRAATAEAGGTLDAAGYRQEMGKAHVGVIRAFLSASGLETSDAAVELYEERFQEAYRKLLATDLRPMPGARELLATCREQGRRLALVTSSERWMAEIVLRALVRRDCSTVPGVRHGLGDPKVFEAVITADDVENEKPHPEPYLRALKGLTGDGVGHDSCHCPGSGGPAVAVEDTPAGVTAASSAGLPVIAVRHQFNRHHPFDGATLILESLDPADRFLAAVDSIAEEIPSMSTRPSMSPRP